MLNDFLTIVIWCVGVVGMATAAWLQDRRDIRRESGELQRLKEEYDDRISNLEKEVGEIRKGRGVMK